MDYVCSAYKLLVNLNESEFFVAQELNNAKKTLHKRLLAFFLLQVLVLTY